nr:retrovirus-related Pol polyprotein from transposon TNT 1-94 [Tanacetum cinerariifolium]
MAHEGNTFQSAKVKLLVKFMSTELSESYNGFMEKTHTWLQAEETASEGRPVVFMDNNHNDIKPKVTTMGRFWKKEQRKGNPRLIKGGENVSETSENGVKGNGYFQIFRIPSRLWSCHECMQRTKEPNLRGSQDREAHPRKEGTQPTVRHRNQLDKAKEPPKIISVENMIFPPIRNRCPYSPVSWKTKKQHTVSRSSVEAEYRSMTLTTGELNG